MGDEAAWLRREVEVLFDVDARGRLTGLNEPDPETAAPRLFAAIGRSERVATVRHDMADSTASRFDELVAAMPPWVGGPGDPSGFERIREELPELGDAEAWERGPAFSFPVLDRAEPADDLVILTEGSAALLDPHFPWTRRFLAERSPVAGIVRDGAIVSACYCARRRPWAAEAGVDTIEAYRGQGHAVRVVAAWARAAEAAGIVPLYSTSWDNAASLAVARRLGLIAYAETAELA